VRTLHIEQPPLLFKLNQSLEDPRDGLTLFGPLDPGCPYGIRWAAVGPAGARSRLKRWVRAIQLPIVDPKPRLSRPFFPGFEAAFRIPWSPTPVHEVDVPDVGEQLAVSDRHQRVFGTVDAYAKRIIQAIREDGVRADVWFVVIPDDVYKYCRPRSPAPSSSAPATGSIRVSRRSAAEAVTQPFLFAEDRAASVPFQFEPNFHNQLKARLLGLDAPTQIVRESTIAYQEVVGPSGKPLHDYDTIRSSIAWNLATAAFYKSGGRPWKLASVREGVCYVGLVFKRDERSADQRTACCAAQMFLDSGDGVVFKGAVGPWYSDKTRQFHIDRRSAQDLLRIALDSYVRLRREPPRELFIHGRTRFDDEEWAGFRSAVGSTTELVGVRLEESFDLKAYGAGEMPVLRGMAAIRDEQSGYLWTRGFVPWLRTYPGAEVPNPLLVEICRGSAPLETVLRDVLALTKLNYNSCKHSDGLPVTLKFADAVGEVLTAGPVGETPPLGFAHYI
jgi:hypothetical protein